MVRVLVQSVKTKLNSKKFGALLPQYPALVAKVLYEYCDNLELWQGMKTLFDPKQRIYQHHCLSEENAVLLETCSTSFNDEERKWRDQLDVGQEVAAMKIEPMLECRAWARGSITKKVPAENPGEACRVLVTFPGDSSIFDREISINSKDLAPISEGKTVEDEEFRKNLKAGDKVDVYDSTRFWYASTIMNIEERETQGQVLPMCYIAFRV